MAGLVGLLFVLAAIGTGIEPVRDRSFGWAGLCALSVSVGLAAPAVAAVT